MEKQFVAQVKGIPVTVWSSLARRPIPSAATQYNLPSSSSNSSSSHLTLTYKQRCLGPKKITERVKGKLRMGAKILKLGLGGVKKIFKQNFSLREGEKLIVGSQCSLSTTAGPIHGLLFISTHKIAFCSLSSFNFTSSTGDFVLQFPYKVMIPVGKIKEAKERQSSERPSRKYIEIVTVDNYEFWFMGFINYRKALKYLEQAISEHSRSH
ncbi:hypothetical protein NMG60_11024208 [Bertholletia excelsa]